MANTRVLLNGLKEYRKSLDRHLSALRGEYSAMLARWNALNAVYDGDAADEFKSHWAQTTARFNEYIARTTAISHMLDERIEHLEEANRRESIL